MVEEGRGQQASFSQLFPLPQLYFLILNKTGKDRRIWRAQLEAVRHGTVWGRGKVDGPAVTALANLRKVDTYMPVESSKKRRPDSTSMPGKPQDESGQTPPESRRRMSETQWSPLGKDPNPPSPTPFSLQISSLLAEDGKRIS